jgi:DNA-binding GntR family transcriptional regulator
LVEVLPNIGPVVATVSAKAVREIYEVRMALEGLAGRLCAERASDDQLDQIAEVIADFARTPSVTEQLQIKGRFYDVLLDAAANDEITRMLGGLRARVTGLRTRTLSLPGRYAETVEELNAILVALRNRDADAAEAACRAHVDAARHTALAELAEI